MKKIILLLSALWITCNASESKKPTIVSCYSSMSSKKQKHEITMSDGTCVTIQNSLIDPQDLKVTVTQKRQPEGKK